MFSVHKVDQFLIELYRSPDGPANTVHHETKYSRLTRLQAAIPTAAIPTNASEKAQLTLTLTVTVTVTLTLTLNLTHGITHLEMSE